MASQKVDLAQLAAVLKPLVSPDVANEIIRKLKRDKAVDDSKPPALKKQFVVYVLPPEGVTLPEDLTGWVVQINEDENVRTSFDTKVAQAVSVYNTTKKGLRFPVKTTGEAFEIVPLKQFKELGVSVKTRSPVWIVPVPQMVPLVASGV